MTLLIVTNDAPRRSDMSDTASTPEGITGDSGNAGNAGDGGDAGVKKALKKSETDNWPRIGKLEIEVALHRGRVTVADVEKAAEMATETFRSILMAKGYSLDVTAHYEYGYRATRKPVGDWGTPASGAA